MYGGAVQRARRAASSVSLMAALSEAQLAAAATMLAGDSQKVAAKVLKVFKKRVRANRTRLSRRRG